MSHVALNVLSRLINISKHYIKLQCALYVRPLHMVGNLPYNYIFISPLRIICEEVSLIELVAQGKSKHSAASGCQSKGFQRISESSRCRKLLILTLRAEVQKIVHPI